MRIDSVKCAASVCLRAATRAVPWVILVSAVLSLLVSSAIAGPQQETSSRSTELDEAVTEESTDTVEVTARREALRKAIRLFVSNVTRADGENVARWRDPICPSVAGVTSEGGEFIRSRILEIAVSAGAPVSGNEHCKSNLLVILTSQPDELWAAWRKRHAKMFGSESPENIKGILDVTRPVRVWQNAILNNADGTPPIEHSQLRLAEYRLKDSRIVSSVAEDFSSAVVVVDTTATGRATFGQLADYVAMVSLVRIDLNADFANHPTMLRLFAKPDSESAPARLTDWDQAFLKALYKSRDAYLQQRALIVTSMAQGLAP